MDQRKFSAGLLSQAAARWRLVQLYAWWNLWCGIERERAEQEASIERPLACWQQVQISKAFTSLKHASETAQCQKLVMYETLVKWSARTVASAIRKWQQLTSTGKAQKLLVVHMAPLNRLLKRAWSCWDMAAKQMVRQQHLLMCGVRGMVHQALRRAFSGWQSTAFEMQLCMEHAALALNFWHNSSVAQALRTWGEHVDLVHWSEHVIRNVILNWHHRILSRSWRSFKHSVNEVIIQRTSVVHVISMWTNRQLASALHTWISHCSWQRSMSQQASREAEQQLHASTLAAKEAKLQAQQAERETELEERRDLELKEMQEAKQRLAEKEAQLDAERKELLEATIESQRQLAAREAQLATHREEETQKEATLRADREKKLQRKRQGLRTWHGTTKLAIYSSRLNETAAQQWRFHRLSASIPLLRQYAKHKRDEKLDADQAHATAIKELASSASKRNETKASSNGSCSGVRIARTKTARDDGKPRVFFILEVKSDDEDSSHQIPRRYKDFDHLDKMIREKFAFLIEDLPCLPPKKSFGALDPHFIASRKITLQQYVSDLLHIPKIRSCDELCAFLSQDLSLWQGLVQD